MSFLPCLLCGNKLEKRSDKHTKPYFVCDSCGIQLFVRKKHGIERLDTLLKAAEANATFLKEAAHRVFEVQALLCEIDGTKAQIKEVEAEIGFLFPDEEKIRARDALKIRLTNLVNQFEDFCKGETRPMSRTSQ
jgi:DNA-directed RNA polymerase subunit RPC12/RpoP